MNTISLLYKIARPFLLRMDAEKAHHLTLNLLKQGLIPQSAPIDSAALRTTLWNLNFPNPVGLAAGFDKNAEVIAPMLQMGFGFVEAGTVTPKSQDGNPRPRIFRDPVHEAVINRMGFPNKGVKTFKINIESFLESRPRPAGLVGLNIGVNKNQTEPAKDYCLLIRQLGPLADYFAVNISSPNTPGLRDLQRRKPLLDLLRKILDARQKSCRTNHPPIFLKLAPDLDEAQQEELAATVLKAGIDGLILTNTTLARPDYLPPQFSSEQGGLSGAPLTDASTEIIRNFYRLTKGKLPIIGLGGVSSARHAYDKIKAGASLIQLYTALAFQGPNVVKEINTGLLRYLKQDGFTHIREAVGQNTK